MTQPDGSPEPARTDARDPALARAFAAVRDAYDAAAATIKAIEDPDEALLAATDLGSVLRVLTGLNGALRAGLAQRIWARHQLSLAKLAQRIGVSKSRAAEMIGTATKQQVAGEEEPFNG